MSNRAAARLPEDPERILAADMKFFFPSPEMAFLPSVYSFRIDGFLPFSGWEKFKVFYDQEITPLLLYQENTAKEAEEHFKQNYKVRDHRAIYEELNVALRDHLLPKAEEYFPAGTSVYVYDTSQERYVVDQIAEWRTLEQDVYKSYIGPHKQYLLLAWTKNLHRTHVSLQRFWAYRD